MSAICIEHVVCERITLLSFALYYPVRSCVRIYIYISTVLQQSVCHAVLSICQKECTNIQALSESPLEVCILTRCVGTLVPDSIWWSASSNTTITGG